MITKNAQEFYSLLEAGKPIISFDWGLKKIGSALSTPDWSFSMPHKLIVESKPSIQISRCLEEINSAGAAGIVIGLPLFMDGRYSDQSEQVLKFAANLEKKISIPIFMQDERLTTKTADNLLRSAGFKRKHRNQNDDNIAANLILETALNLLKQF